MFTQILAYVLFPASAIVIGGAVAVLRPPGLRLQSVIQHFAAGVVFAAVAGELLPEVMREGAPLPTVIGFALGVALMLGVKRLTERAPSEVGGAESGSRGSGGLVWTVAVDVAVDGLLVGVGFAAGTEVGLLVTAALTLEVLFLALATTAALIDDGASRARALLTVGGLALLLIAGASVGGAALQVLTGGFLVAVLAFGVAALLYLVTEELLVEAHETPDTPLATATFFLGFLVLLLVEMAI